MTGWLTVRYLTFSILYSIIFVHFQEEQNMKFSAENRMQTLLNAPEAVEVLERYYPKILKNPALQMTRCMSLRAVASFAQSGLTPELLEEIDSELREIP